MDKTLEQKALLVLADGSIYEGISIGAQGYAIGEVVFNTALTGYQEILTDPSYYKQIITFTHPHIGNIGCNNEDKESNQIWASGLIIKEISRISSNWRSQISLTDWLLHNQVIGIANIDTRSLTKRLRETGAQSGCIMAGNDINPDQALEMARNWEGLQGADLAKEVTTNKQYPWFETVWQQDSVKNYLYHVVAYDFGIKHNILRLLVSYGCQVTVVPAKTSAEEVLAMQPDGIFLSNGPGDPEPCSYAIEATKLFLEHKIPVFGICLGHQLLSLALGAKTYKMKFGHHGANHPVKDLSSERVFISSQNHGFAVDQASLPNNVAITHISLFDGSLQGIECQDKPAFSFQGHPEASPGPHEMRSLFLKFNELMKNYQQERSDYAKA